MAFALTSVRLEEAMKQQGCLVCRLGIEAAEHSVDSFLWENVNDPVVRKPIIDAYGFCPEHTRLLVAREMSSSGPVLGMNIIYEQLGRVVGKELQNLSFGQRVTSSIREWWQGVTSAIVQAVMEITFRRGAYARYARCKCRPT